MLVSKRGTAVCVSLFTVAGLVIACNASDVPRLTQPENTPPNSVQVDGPLTARSVITGTISGSAEHFDANGKLTGTQKFNRADIGTQSTVRLSEQLTLSPAYALREESASAERVRNLPVSSDEVLQRLFAMPIILKTDRGMLVGYTGRDSLFSKTGALLSVAEGRVGEPASTITLYRENVAFARIASRRQSAEGGWILVGVRIAFLTHGVERSAVSASAYDLEVVTAAPTDPSVASLYDECEDGGVLRADDASEVDTTRNGMSSAIQPEDTCALCAGKYALHLSAKASYYATLALEQVACGNYGPSVCEAAEAATDMALDFSVVCYESWYACRHPEFLRYDIALPRSR